MKRKHSAIQRILAIAPSRRGFGFAVLEGGALIDWGLKVVSGEKNPACLEKAELLLKHYVPDVLAFEDYAKSRRGTRILLLIQAIVDLAPKYNASVKLFARPQMYLALFSRGKGTKDAVADALAKRYPDELAHRLPPKRKSWNSEDSRMAIFDAVALALMVSI